MEAIISPKTCMKLPIRISTLGPYLSYMGPMTTPMAVMKKICSDGIHEIWLAEYCGKSVEW